MLQQIKGNIIDGILRAFAAHSLEGHYEDPSKILVDVRHGGGTELLRSLLVLWASILRCIAHVACVSLSLSLYFPLLPPKKNRVEEFC
jgi:hypothetical protein